MLLYSIDDNGTITATQHGESEVTDRCSKCGGLLIQPPSTYHALKADNPLCLACDPRGLHHVVFGGVDDDDKSAKL